MANKIVGVGEFAVSSNPAEEIKTFALGSCVAAIFLYKPTRTVGLIHMALPESSIDIEKAKKWPGYFVDTGIPALLALMREKCGIGVISSRDMIVKLAGGANIMDFNNAFNIGKRNILSTKKILWGLGMGPISEDVGGNHSRTVTVQVNTGKVILSCPGRGQWEI